jgi:hypothetical protein
MVRILSDVAKRTNGQLIDFADVRCFDERQVTAEVELWRAAEATQPGSPLLLLP